MIAQFHLLVAARSGVDAVRQGSRAAQARLREQIEERIDAFGGQQGTGEADCIEVKLAQIL
jgi:hypothetical protein